MRARSLAALAAMAAIAVVLGGCGGSGGPGGARGSGALSVAVLFPPTGAPSQQAKVIPPGTNSVVVRVLDPDTRANLVPYAVISRPAGSNEARTTIEHVPAGLVLVEGLAKPTASGSGATLAQATAEVEVPSGGTAQVGLNLFGVAATVQVAPSNLAMLTTKTAQLHATAYDAIGNVIVGAQFAWESSDTAAATVSDAGAVTAVAPGDSTVTATETREGVSDSCAVTVTQRQATQLEIEPSGALLRSGETARLTAIVRDAEGDAMAEEHVTWQCDAPGIATVDAAGLVTAVSEGDATVTALTANGHSDTALVDVSLYVIKLAWAGDATLDLHVFGPDYAHASRQSPEIPAGKLITDTGIPTARQLFSGRSPDPGAYYLAVNYYEGTGAVQAEVTIEGIGPGPVLRTRTLSTPNRNSGYPVLRNTASWFRPLDVFISADAISTFGPDTTVALYESSPSP
jgi:hypothetical protein